MLEGKHLLLQGLELLLALNSVEVMLVNRCVLWRLELMRELMQFWIQNH